MAVSLFTLRVLIVIGEERGVFFIEHHCEKHIDWLNNINDDDGLSPYLTENVLTLQLVAAHKHVNYRCCHKDSNYHTNYVFAESCGGLWVVFLVEIVQ